MYLQMRIAPWAWEWTHGSRNRFINGNVTRPFASDLQTVDRDIRRNILFTSSLKNTPMTSWCSTSFPVSSSTSNMNTSLFRFRAVVHGVNFSHTNSLKLGGGIGDALRVRDFLKNRIGIDVNNPSVFALCIDNSWTPSTSKILFMSIDWLMTDLKPGDCRMLHYSGHGVWINNPEQYDRLETCLLSVDAEEPDVPTFSDQDFIERVLTRMQNSHVSLFVMCDSCYSGPNMIHLRYAYEMQPNGHVVIHEKKPGEYYHLTNCRVIYLGASRGNQKAAEVQDRLTDYSKPIGHADTTYPAEYGALTDAYFDALDTPPVSDIDGLPVISIYDTLLAIAQYFSKNGLNQHAQLCSSVELDLRNTRFVDIAYNCRYQL